MAVCSHCGRFDGFKFPRLFGDCFFALNAAVHSRWLCNWLAKFSAGFGLDAVERGILNVGYNWKIGCLVVYRFGQVENTR